MLSWDDEPITSAPAAASAPEGASAADVAKRVNADDKRIINANRRQPAGALQV